MFNYFLLSDSFALSFTLLYLSCLISGRELLTRLGWPLFYLLYFGLAAIALGTRDANQMIVLFGSFLFLVLQFRHRRKIELLVFLACVLALVNASLQAAQKRHGSSQKALIAVQILPDPEARAFFVEHGMPAQLAAEGANMKPMRLDNLNIPEVLQRMGNISALYDPFAANAPRVYIKWLLTHPLWVIQVALEYRHEILSDWTPFSPPQSQESLLTRPGDLVPTIFKRVPRLSLSDYFSVDFKLLIYFGSLAWLLVKRRSLDDPLLLALLVGGLGLLNGLAGYLADIAAFQEMRRHALIGNLLFQAGFMVCLGQFVFSFTSWGKELLFLKLKRKPKDEDKYPAASAA